MNKNKITSQKYTTSTLEPFEITDLANVSLSFISLFIYFLFYEKFMKIGREAIPIPGLEQTINKVARGPKALLG